MNIKFLFDVPRLGIQDLSKFIRFIPKLFYYSVIGASVAHWIKHLASGLGSLTAWLCVFLECEHFHALVS